jgi:hypothetical protein
MTEPVFNPELDRRLRAALADPPFRVGNLHSVERSFPYDPQYPFIAVTFSWMEPDDDDTKVPDVMAMTLHVPEILIPPIARALNNLTATGHRGSPPKTTKRRRPKR